MRRRTYTPPPPKPVSTEVFGPSLMNITCGTCGHCNDALFFTYRLLEGDFKPNHFQCPKCETAWVIVLEDKKPRNTLVPIQPCL
jgi:hypothetical protein